jgi:hypothetical protein
MKYLFAILFTSKGKALVAVQSWDQTIKRGIMKSKQKTYW